MKEETSFDNFFSAASSVDESVGGETSTKGTICLETSGERCSRQFFSPVFHLKIKEVYLNKIQKGSLQRSLQAVSFPTPKGKRRNEP